MAIYPNGIIPNNYAGMTKAQFLMHPIGTGPFMLGTWTQGQELKLVRNPSYWQKGLPYLDSVTFTDVGDDTTRINQLKGGQANVIEFPPFSSLQSLSRTPNVVVKEFPADRVDFLMMNNAQAPFNDVHVRLAIAYSVDRAAMIRALLFGYGKPANSYLPPELAFYDPNAPGPQYDPAKAKAEMALSSHPGGFTATLLIVGGNTIQTQLAQIVQQEVAPLGITLTIQPEDQNTEITNVDNGKYGIAWQYWTSDVVDGDELASALNLFGVNYNDPTFTQLVTQANATFGKSQRQQLYDQVQAREAQDSPVVSLWYQPFAYAYSSNVHAFLAAPTGDYELQNVWLSSS
jgi:peptide/nickel transport system substrate-binding protein